MKRSHVGAMLVCILISTGIAFSQSASTSLRGLVKDPSGALVPNASVTLLDKGTQKTFSATTGEAGAYQFPQIPPARYTVTVSSQGFGTQSKTAELLVNQPATIDFQLAMESSTVTVDVSASAQTLNTTDATLGDSVGNQTIEALPMEGRDPVALLTLQPGVLYLGNPAENDTVDSRSGSVNGGRSDQGNITLDGLDDNDQIQGTAFTGVLRSTLDSTEEFRVTTSNGTAGSGRSSGAQVSLVTKAGTNKFHGSLYEYYRPTNTVANNWFNKNQQLADGDPNRPQKYVQNVFGGSIGGPILKDKLFFFFNYEGLRQAISDVIQATVPTSQFYQGELGYIDNAGQVNYLDAAQFQALDSLTADPTSLNPNGWIGCSTNIPCGVNQAVLDYYQPLKTAGIFGTGKNLGDGAINSGGYVFTSPAPKTLNTSIFKLDYNLNSKQTLFVRGNLQKDTQGGDANLPGQPADSTHEDNTKGIVAGHTWLITSNMANDLRYGYIRQGYSTLGIGSGQGDWVNFRALTQPTSQKLSIAINVPIHNLTDDLTWTKGNHTISLGGNWRAISNNRGTDQNSYSYASTDPYWMYDFPNVPNFADNSLNLINDGSFDTSYEFAYADLVGTVPQTNAQYNYKVTSKTTGSQLSDGAFINRYFHGNEFEYYLQDSWRIKPNLTVTVGLRHSILQAPYETKGQQVSPTVNTDNWYKERGYAATKGIVAEDPLTFIPSGKANGRPGYWAKQKANIAPRLSFVYSPDSKTSIRAGGGMYYDHFGQGIVDAFDQEGSFGLTTTIETPASYFGYENSPRFTGPHNIPSLAGSCGNLPNITYPFIPPNNLDCGFAIGWGIDTKIKTPYSYDLDLSFQRELPGGFLFEEAYVGRLGRHLLQQIDLAEPVNLSDPKGGGDYFHAASQLSRLSDQHAGNTAATVPKIQYFEDVFPFEANKDYIGESATQSIYTNQWAPLRYGAGETQALLDIDLDNPNGLQFWNSQFSSLYSWATIGNSSYNALQFTLRHPASHGLTTDISYTFSKSLDMGSGVERANWESTDSFGGNGAIQNTWNPKGNKAVSDFDTRHLITVDAVYTLPIGRGKYVLANANRLIDAVIGGWQLSGLSRYSSGLPFSLSAPGWATNWNLEGSGVVTGPVKIRKHLVGGLPQVFDNPDAISSGVQSGGPVRLPYPGESGDRNHFRGDGYFDIDSSLSKTWGLTEGMKLKFAGEVYNVPNNVRFDASPLNLNANLPGTGTLGYYSGVLTTYRRMQFGLRLDF